MTKNDTDNTGDTLHQPHDSNQYNNKTILGHNITVHKLDNWHQVCFQWCHQQHQQGQAKNCSMYCFKYKNNTKDTADDSLPSFEKATSTETNPTDITFTDRATNAGQTIKHYMTDFLKSYSIVVVKGTDFTTDSYMKAHQNDRPPNDPSIHEINIGAKAETVVNNAELVVKKTHDFSKDLISTWQSNNKYINEFNYGGTFRIMKDRLVKIVDVARGKYDNNDVDNLKKKPTNHDGDDPRTSETNMDQNTPQDDDNSNSKKNS